MTYSNNYVCDAGKSVWFSDVRYIDFISISRYFCTYRTVSKSILHLLMLDKYRTAGFSIIYQIIKLDINLLKGIYSYQIDIVFLQNLMAS